MNTPRTDAVGNNGGYYRSKEHGWYIPADFCRQLETELKAEREKVAKLKQALHNLAQPCTRMDYTVAKLDEVICRIASEALEETK